MQEPRTPWTGTAVPYDATARRPDHSALPEHVQAVIVNRFGAPIASSNPAGGGFTGGFAAIVTATNGERMFVKAAGPDTPHILASYRQEARVNGALPRGVPAPELRFTAHAGDWIVLGFEPLTGVAPALPMKPDDVRLMLDTWAQAAEALSPTPASLRAIGLRPLAEDAGADLLRFGAMVGGEIPVAPMPSWAPAHLDELAALETGVYAAVEADAVTHGDLRPDNIVLGADRAWICDWNWPTIAAPWFDTVMFLITAYGDGHDADALFAAHPTARGVEPERLDAVIAAAAGYYADRANQVDIPGLSPYLRRHQRWCAEAALSWLASRRGW